MRIGKNHIAVWLVKANLGIANENEHRLPKTLCSLFWSLVLSVFIQAISWPFLFFIPFYGKARKDPGKAMEDTGFNFPLASMIWQLLASLPFVDRIGLFAEYFGGYHHLVWLFMASMVVIPVSTFLVLYIGYKITEGVHRGFLWTVRSLGLKKGPEGGEKEPSVVREYFRATKEKLCSIMEYEDR